MAPVFSFALVALVASAAALTTPLVTRDHSALAARLMAREPAPVAAQQDYPLRRKSRRSSRCPGQVPMASANTKAATPATTKPTTVAVPVNAEPAPAKETAPAPAATSSKSTPAPPPPAPAPKPTSTAAPHPTSAPAPANPGMECGPMSLTGTMSGDGTYYGTGLGACGITNNDNDYIVAVSKLLYDSFPGATANPNNNPLCGRKINAHYNGKSVTVTAVDRCEACACGSLDFSPAAFSVLADQSLGRLHNVTWNWA